MFGLMKAKNCGMSPEEKHFRRLHYCGTCKTIGSLYGQKSRLLLDHDTVFLAEFLTALSDDKVGDWGKSYQSYNCLSLPKNELPLSLSFAAAANIILSEFKIADHISDEKKPRFKIAKRLFFEEFRVAEKQLEEWVFPLEKVREILRSQEKREAESKNLNVLAEPTAQATAVFFSEGVKLVGKSAFEKTASGIGYKFGKLIYLLDAFEDYEKDFSADKFNAIRSAYGLSESKIPVSAKRKITILLRELESQIISAIYNLPFSESQKAVFASRLQQNLQRKIQTNLPVVQAKKSCLPKQTLTDRWRKSVETARKMAREFSWQMPLVFLFVLILTFTAPAQTRDAKSARECFDLSFNLMFLGAIAGSVLAAPSLIMQQISPEKLAKKAQKKQEEGWCDWCDCCGCDCDCCDCCEGGCCDCSCD